MNDLLQCCAEAGLGAEMAKSSSQVMYPAFLSCEQDDGSNALVLPSRGRKGKPSAAAKQDPVAQPELGKRQRKSLQRKLRKIQEEKEKRERQLLVFKTLEQHKLSDDTLELLHPSSMRGQTETMKVMLRRAMKYERAGLPVPADVPLLRKRKCSTDLEGMEDNADSDDNHDEDTRALGGQSRGVGNGSQNLSDSATRIMPASAVGRPHGGAGKEDVKETGDGGMVRNLQQENKMMMGNTEPRAEAVLNTGNQLRTEDDGGVEVRRRQHSNESMDNERGRSSNDGEAGMKQGDTAQNRTDGGEVPRDGEGEKRGRRKKKRRRKDSKENQEVNEATAGKDRLLADADMKNTAACGTATNVNDTETNVNDAQRRAKAFVVSTQRLEEVQKGRSKLPIIGMEQEIMEAVTENAVIVVCGETGCGKTTQVPQFLYEAGYGAALCKEHPGAIGVTQPRRVAAVTTAKRVAYELNVQLGKVVGFQVRYDRQAGEGAAIKFMTDGILLREVQSDFLLRKYSVIIIDEAHERSLNTDILIGLLSRIVPLRQSLFEEQQASLKKKKPTSTINSSDCITPLKLIIMSATLRVEDFVENAQLFRNPPPVVKVPARQFPVTVHFSKRTELVDYVGAAYKKVCQIHRRLPPGGVLVFLTGQREVEWLCRKLRKSFNKGGKLLSRSGENDEFKAKSDEADKGDVSGSASELKDEAKEDEEIWKAADGDDQRVGNEENMHGPRRRGGWHAYGQDSVEVEDIENNNEDSEEEEEEGGEEEEDEDEQVENSEGEEWNDSREGRWWKTLQEKAENGDGEHGKDKVQGNDDEEGNKEKSDMRIADDRVTPEEPQTQELEGGITSLGSDIMDKKERGKGGAPPKKMHVLPLYAMLPAKVQLRVFAPPPEGSRLVVVATNVAETSITIPGIRYVVDCGRAKEREYDRASGVSSFEVDWISKASADQRAGRAGRTGPGHCYRLYSSAVFNNQFEQHRLAEIHRSPIEGIVLQMKAMGIDKVLNFPYPTPPDRGLLSAAEKSLMVLSALTPGAGLLTPIGRAMAVYPISPRHSRMLVAAMTALRHQPVVASKAQSKVAQKAKVCLAYVLAIAAGLSLESPFLWAGDSEGDGEKRQVEQNLSGGQGADGRTQGQEGVGMTLEAGQAQGDEKKDDDWMLQQAKEKRTAARKAAAIARAQFSNPTSDVLTVVNALREYEKAEKREEFCTAAFLHLKTMEEMVMLRKQLVRIAVRQWEQQKEEDECTDAAVWLDLREEDLELEGTLDTKGEEVVRRAICAGWADRVARRLHPGKNAKLDSKNGGEEEAHDKRRRAVRYQACSLDETAYLHPSSSVAKEAPDWVVYSDIMVTSRPYMRGVTAVNSRWLATEAPAMCTFPKPLDDPPPWYAAEEDKVKCWVVPTFGPHLWELPPHGIEMKAGRERVSVFAKALLEGKVFPSMKELTNCLVADPALILKKEGAGHVRVGELLSAMGCRILAKGAAAAIHRVDSRSKLLPRLSSDPSFLRNELVMWVREHERGRLERIWGEIARQARASAEPDRSDRKDVRSTAGFGSSSHQAADGSVRKGRNDNTRCKQDGSDHEMGAVGFNSPEKTTVKLSEVTLAQQQHFRGTEQEMDLAEVRGSEMKRVKLSEVIHRLQHFRGSGGKRVELSGRVQAKKHFRFAKQIMMNELRRKCHKRPIRPVEQK
ncbi:hypothetical protein CBR_g66799 [Chara braunii]|uniref:RNA helicase n=1 Tax=Chara braunii TaxID=69332 RepID=A0A388K9B0_CHABU|nr:hypothetical protein CBR_g66799 [Chara braunii]|eukprot:GBG66664.1 hypothetical protein CBR_g66799 [Chara braunii]